MNNYINAIKQEKFIKMINENDKIFDSRKFGDLKDKLFEFLFLTPFYKIINQDTFCFLNHDNISKQKSKNIFNLIISYEIFTIDADVLIDFEDDPDEYPLYFYTDGYIPKDIQRDIKNEVTKARKTISDIK
jgi:hypothetical protein